VCSMAMIKMVVSAEQPQRPLGPQDPARNAAVFEALPKSLLIHDEHTILATNAACRRVFGATSAEQLAGQPLETIVHPDGREAGATRRAVIFRGGVPGLTRVPLKLRRLDGTEVRLAVDAVALEVGGHRATLVTPSML